MNRIKFTVLFVVTVSIFLIGLIIYFNSKAYERNGYEIVKSNLVFCEQCKIVSELNDGNYLGTKPNLALFNEKGEEIKAFENFFSPQVLYKTKDNSIVVYYFDKKENQYYIGKFAYLGNYQVINGPFKYLLTSPKDSTNYFYLLIEETGKNNIIKFNEQGEEVFRIGPLTSLSILKQDQAGVIVKYYDQTTLKNKIERYDHTGEIKWSKEINYIYNITTFDDGFVFYSMEADGKYIYKLDFDGNESKVGPFDRKYDNNRNWAIRTFEKGYLFTNIISNKKVLTVLDQDFEIINTIENYDYTNIMKSSDSDDIILTNTVNNEIYMVKLDKEFKEVFNKKMDGNFEIKYVSSNEVIYTTKVDDVSSSVYLDKLGNKKWQVQELMTSSITKHKNLFYYLTKNDKDQKQVIRNLNGVEVMSKNRIASLIAIFDNGDFLYYINSEKGTYAQIMNSKGDVIFNKLLNGFENTKEQLFIYTEDEKIIANNDYLYANIIKK